MAQLNIYSGNVTAGATDGTLVNISGILKYAGERGELGEPVTYGLRCPIATNVYNVKVSVTGTNPSWVQLSTNDTSWASSIEFANVGATNTLFYVQLTIPPDAEYNQTVLNNLVLKYIETVLPSE